MNPTSVLVLGTGHLATRTKKLITEKGYTVTHVSSLLNHPSDAASSTLQETEIAFKELDMQSFTKAYVLFEKEEDNLEIVIAMTALFPDLPIITSLFNEHIRPHLEKANPQLTILNPARVAAPFFVEALDTPLTRKAMPLPDINLAEPTRSSSDYFLMLLVILFALIMITTATIFHYREELSWLDAFYFVVVTISTVGYGDINLQHSDAVSKLTGIGLILCSSLFIWLIFSLLIDRIIKKKAQLILGRKKYHYKDHIIICGLGRLGYFIADELRKKGEKIVIIEINETSSNSDYFRSQHVAVYNGNARQPQVLQDAGAAHCRALISVINDDYTNLEIALNARHFQPDLRIILRIFDESMAQVIKDKFDIHLSKSMSFIAAEKFASFV